jgi:hypothetical protein
MMPRLLALALAVALPARAGADEFEALHKEQLGALKIGAPSAAVIAALGQPSKKSKLEHRAVDGNYGQTWDYASKGLTIEMAGPKRKGDLAVDSIRAVAPCALKTARGIGVGSSAAELKRAYAAERNAEESSDDRFVAGSIYGGVLFTIAGGRVTEIFIGAAAE